MNYIRQFNYSKDFSFADIIHKKIIAFFISDDGRARSSCQAMLSTFFKDQYQ